jgi:hypothetical protein
MRQQAVAADQAARAAASSAPAEAEVPGEAAAGRALLLLLWADIAVQKEHGCLHVPTRTPPAD